MYKDIKEFTRSKTFQRILISVGIFICALIIFQAGMFIGFRKASFSYRFGDNYYRAFGDRGPKPFRGSMMMGTFIESNGAVGKIISINLPTFVLLGRDNIEKVILIKNDTQIRHLNASATSSDLKVDDFVVAFGSPNENSEIEAKLVRIMPVPNNTPFFNIKTQ